MVNRSLTTETMQDLSAKKYENISNVSSAADLTQHARSEEYRLD